jgi:DNA-binding NarL/FixJ family response regulator
VIGLSAFAEPHSVEAMLEAGAVGHFAKGDVGDALLQAIHTATRERRRFGADIAVPAAADGTTATVRARAPAHADANFLGVRELEVLRLIARGLASPQIADSLSMDPTMVAVYRRNIMRKLNLTGDAALGDYARDWSLKRDSGDKPA